MIMNKTFLIVGTILGDRDNAIIWEMEIISPILNDISLWNKEFRNQSLRAVIREFLSTEEGKNIAKDNGDDFNWGDAMLHIPDELWKKHGLKLHGQVKEGIEVNHDENFVPQV